MLYKFTTLMLVILLVGFLQAQNRVSHQTQPNVVLTGSELSEVSNSEVVKVGPPIKYNPVYSGGFTWDVHNVGEIANGYDLQSNSSTQQLWYDLNNPGYLHAVIMTSQQPTGWTDRTSTYLGSVDNGVTWFELGGVPVGARSGYCTIKGTSTGAAVIMNHPDYGTPARPRSIVYIDSSPFEYNFTAYEPALLNDANPYVIWPRMVVDANDNIIFGGAQSTNYGTADSMYTNRFDYGSLSFDGWVVHDGDQAETYPFAISDGGKIGQAFLGGQNLSDAGDGWYRESTDGGMTWSDPIKFFTRDHSNDTTWGTMRGVTINFFGEEPCIAFEDGWQDFVGGQYRQGDANTMYFWSPSVNGGTPVVLFDSSWVHWNPGGGANDVMMGVSRPVLARSQTGNYLFLAFNAASANTYPLNQDSPFFDGWFMYSSDGGNTWSDVEKFTPDGPPLTDWRYASMPEVLPVDGDMVNVHIIMEADTLAGSQVQGTGIDGVTARYYHFSTQIQIVGVDDDIIVNNFNLEQNYPNPFNPSTTINYSLAKRSAVTLKVYDVLGNEVANLVNSTQEAGKHSINFNAANLASGLYIYTLNTGNFTSSKKMMLLK